ncbi:hypothetical protein E4U21_001765 [Claviceps maximensis]|nr:hypothetical protein E4U21_001765 [Claviceps maximensis]
MNAMEAAAYVGFFLVLDDPGTSEWTSGLEPATHHHTDFSPKLWYREQTLTLRRTAADDYCFVEIYASHIIFCHFSESPIRRYINNRYA